MENNLDDEIPKFIRLRGCKNCEVVKEGDKYAFHVRMGRCIIECGYVDIINPFIDPKDAVRFAKKDGSPQVLKETREYCMKVKELFGEYYETIGISINDIIKSLDSRN